MINLIQTYNSTETICNELYPEGVFMTYDAPSTFYTLFKALPLVYSVCLTATGSKMGLVAGFVTNFIVTYLSEGFTTSFRNLAIEQAQGWDVDWREGFTFDERYSLLQYGTVVELLPRTTTSVARTIANQGWSTYRNIGPLEQSLKGFELSDFINEYQHPTYSKIFSEAKSAKIGLERNLRGAMNEEEAFSETARNILSQIGVFKKTDKRPYYALIEVNTNDEQLKSAYQSICDLFLSEDILSEMPSSDQTDQWKEAKAYLGKLKSEGLFREIDKLKKSLTKNEINPFDRDMSREDFITQLQMLWASLDLNHQNKEEIILESKRLEIWKELNELREAQHLPPYARDAVIGKTPESWSQKIWRQRDWLDRAFKVVEVAGLISQISDFVREQFRFSKKLRNACFAQVEAN